MVFYNLPAFARGDATAFLSALSRPHGLIKKHGELDLIGAARIVLRDWSTGKLARYSQPPASSTPSATSAAGEAEPDSEFSELYKADEEILSAAPLRKDMRRGAGLIKLTQGEVEKRNIALEAAWDESDDEEEGDDDDEDEDEDGVGSDVELAEDISGDDDDDDEVEEEADEDEESDEDVPPPTKGKRKRQEKSTHAPSSKKVAFAAPPKGSKQARAQPPSKSSSKTAAKATPKTPRRK